MTMGHSIGKYSMIPLYVLCIALCYPVSGQTEQGILNVTAEGAFGKEAIIKCILTPVNLTAKWLFQGADVQFGDRITQNKTVILSGRTDNDGINVTNLEMTLRIAKTSDADVGNYTCEASGQSRSVILNLSYPGKLVDNTKGPLRFNITEGGAKPVLNLTCTFEVYNQTKVEWVLQRERLEDKQLEGTTYRDKNNPKLLKSYFTTPIVLSAFDDQNGTYICQTWDPDTLRYIIGKTKVLIYAAPVLDITYAIAISSSQIFFNWTVKNYNSPIKRYDFFLSDHDAVYRLAVEYRIDPKSTKHKYVIEGLKKNTTYNIKLSVITAFGYSKLQQFPTPKHEVRTLLKDPVFVPNISINGFSSKSMTIGLSPPPPDVAEYVHYYRLERWKKGYHNETLKVADHYRDDRNLPYMFNDLEPHSTYVFRARACSDYTKQCGEWSEEMEAVTLDGTPDKPTDVHIDCLKQDGRNYMILTWGPPAKPNAEIKGYMMEVTGNMTYINRFGIEATETWGPLSKFMTNNSRTVRVEDLKPNANYTVRLSAMTRTRRRGLEEIAFCKTKPAPPDNPPRPKFIKHGEKTEDAIKYSLRVLVPRSSERNGPICCYRVYVVRLLPGLGWSKLPPPADLKTLNFHEAHSPNADIGAYVTDVFNNENFPKDELILGDEVTVTLKPVERNTTCARCFFRRRLREAPRLTTSAPEEDTTADDDLLTEGGRDERSVEDDRFANNEMLKTKKSVVRDEPLEVIDGRLDPQANYALFVELIPGTDDEPLFSGYTVALNTAIPENALDTNTMELESQTEQGILNVTAEGAFGKEAIIKCILTPVNLTAKWLFQGADVQFGDRITQNKTVILSGRTDNDGINVINLEVTLRIAKTSDADVGNYTCEASGQSRSVILNLSYPGKLVDNTKGPLRFNITEGGAKPVLNLTCTFEVYNQTKVEWVLQRERLEDKQLEGTTYRDKNNPKLLKSYFTTPIVLSAFDDQNGTYICQTWDPDTLRYIIGKTKVLIYAAPVLDITYAIAISSSQIFFNWTVKNYNSPIKRYDLYLSEHDDGHRLAVERRIDPNSTKHEYVMEGLKKNTTYDIKLVVITAFGASKPQQFPTPKHEVRTLLKDPMFVPNISINGFSSKSMTIGLSPPPPDVAEYVHYYMLERWKKGYHNETLKVADHYRDDRNLPYMFNDLEPHSTYVFRARACSDYTKQCGEWSEEMEAVTLDGTPDKPTDVHIDCLKQDGRNYMNLTWGPPAKPNAEIKGYMMEVTGNMTYINRFGIEATETWGPLSKFMTNNSRTVRVEDLKPNANYTVRLSAMTRTRRRGLEEIAFCKTKPAPPDNPPRPKFIKHGEKTEDAIKYSLRVLVPRSSERNGPICCYRVYVVRLLPGLGWSKLPPPADLKTLNFHEAHSPNADIGAYVTDVFNNENFPKDELILGDEVTVTLKPVERNTTCARCFFRRRLREAPRLTTSAPEEDTTADDDLLTEGGRDERSVEDDRFANDEMLKTKKSVVRDEPLEVIDGKLDPQANYTLFVELIPGTDDEPLFSGYTVALNTAIPENALDTNTMELESPGGSVDPPSARWI